MIYWGRKYYFPSVAWIRGEKIAFSCLQQAGERNFLTSYSHNQWDVINPSPVLPSRQEEEEASCMTEILFVKLFRYNQLCIRKIHSASRPPPSSSRNRNRERACGGGVRRAMCHDIVMPESSVLQIGRTVERLRICYYREDCLLNTRGITIDQRTIRLSLGCVGNWQSHDDCWLCELRAVAPTFDRKLSTLGELFSIGYVIYRP